MGIDSGHLELVMVRHTIVAGLTPLLVLFAAGATRAQIAMRGDFTAERDCPAVVSIRKRTNPDSAKLTPDRVYALIAANAKPATHYRLRVPGARPRERWVEADCGFVGTRPRPKPATGRGPEYVLALTWQPAYCEMRRSRPECAKQTAQRFDADHFTLHGLWPQPHNNIYCGVSERQRKARWSRIPALALTPATRSDLHRAMPASASYLHRHEWLKHGTCYGKSAEAYFVDSLALLKQVNTSALQRTFAANIGDRLTAAEVRAAVDRSFGRGTGTRTTMNCRKDMITELQFNLRGPIDRASRLGDLLRNAAGAPVRCAAGWVDPVGIGSAAQRYPSG